MKVSEEEQPAQTSHGSAALLLKQKMFFLTTVLPPGSVRATILPPAPQQSPERGSIGTFGLLNRADKKSQQGKTHPQLSGTQVREAPYNPGLQVENHATSEPINTGTRLRLCGHRGQRSPGQMTDSLSRWALDPH